MEEFEKPVVITEPKNHNDSKNVNTPPQPALELGSDRSYQPSRKTKKSSKWLIGLAAVLIVGGAAGYGGAWIEDKFDNDGTSVLTASKEDGNATVTANEESIASVAKTVSPSVVSILTSVQQASRYSQGYEQQGAGTGMIVSPDGYILTNKHVIDGADEVAVALTNGEVYDDVQVMGADPLNDVAFLKINGAKDLPAVELGDSKTIRIGQSVVAIGNALGQYQNTVTSGIVSGTGRPIVASSNGTSGGDAENLSDLIQTDASINPGNSGGPLLNLKGQVIGINTAVASDAQGIGFAIPIGATKGMLEHLIETGKVERAYLGVQYVSINSQVKEEYDLPVNKGDYVTATQGSSVQKGGPADKAGIKDKDIITAVNGFKVGEVASVASLVSEYQPGDKVEITILRDGKEQTVTATLGAYQG